MILYHATPKRNLASIQQNGLDPDRASGQIKGVWLHTTSKTAWAILHTIKRHGLQSFDDVVLLRVNVTRSKLTRRWRGLWTTNEAITDFTEIDAAMFAASPIRQAKTRVQMVFSFQIRAVACVNKRIPTERTDTHAATPQKLVNQSSPPRSHSKRKDNRYETEQKRLSVSRLDYGTAEAILHKCLIIC